MSGEVQGGALAIASVLSLADLGVDDDGHRRWLAGHLVHRDLHEPQGGSPREGVHGLEAYLGTFDWGLDFNQITSIGFGLAPRWRFQSACKPRLLGAKVLVQIPLVTPLGRLSKRFPR